MKRLKWLFLAVIVSVLITGPAFGKTIRGPVTFTGDVTFMQTVDFKKAVSSDEADFSSVQYSDEYWVSSSTGANVPQNGASYNAPYATIAYALDQCTASKGDKIYVMPGYTETVISATSLALDVAGVEIIGLGDGALRPTITYTTAATACVYVTGANMTVKNFIFTANYADIAKAIDIDAVNFRMEGCSFYETAANMNFLSIFENDDTANAADGLTIINNERIAIDTASLAFISILGDISRLTVVGNFDNQASAADVGHFIILAAKTALGAKIVGNVLNLTGDNNAQTVGVFMTGSSGTCTGTVANNLCGSLDTTGELFDTATLTFQHFNNYCTGTVAKSGTILPAIET